MDEPLAKKLKKVEIYSKSRFIDTTDTKWGISSILKKNNIKFYEFIDDSNGITEQAIKSIQIHQPLVDDILNSFFQSFLLLVKTFYPNYKI